ncbi:flagellar FlbD family protein [Blastococcus sp. TF02A_35]|uniref:flagellar FlbD family protein n=1 Tax=Blastococcus sp. TF02A-35 TaxID=2559612 RepID=UPI00143070C5|nr:flagellar FlbD family protein [Blastococcus sp. TF02A_35]
MIAVTCRNGEHFSVDPDTIERIEKRADTLVVLVDGTHFVTETDFDELLHTISAHRAGALVTRARLVNGYAAMPNASRLARRHGSGTAGS